MREIKFRAWDFVKNEWFYFTIEELLTHKVELRLMALKWESEFTGLLDKNGKEIYEGDIVEIQRGKGADYAKFKSEVVFEHSSYGGLGWKLKRNEGDNRLSALNNYRASKSEIIGNIYQNKDLLN